MDEGELDSTNGVLYIAVGDDFIREAKMSAKSVRQNMGDISITIIADSDVDSDLFDKVIVAKSPERDFKNKIKYIKQSPYERTLFLDTDTYVDDDVSDLFKLLDEFDMGIALSPYRSYQDAIKTEDGELKVSNLPSCYPQYNTGVIIYKDNSEVNNLFRSWQDIAHSKNERKNTGDQMSFMEAMYNSNVRYVTIPREYNFRYRNSKDIVGKVNIFHGRLISLESYGRGLDYPVEEVRKKVNESINPRVCIANTPEIKVIDEPSISRRVLDSIKRYGLIQTMIKFGKYLIGQ